MAWALQFDGVNDRASFSAWTATGDFTVSGKFTYNNATEVYLGDFTGSTHFVACISGGTVRARVANVSINLAGFTAGDVVEYTLTRVGTGSNNITFTVGASSATGTTNGSFVLNTFGTYAGGSLHYGGQTRGTATLSRAGDVRTYDMDASIHSSGTVIVTDTTSSLNATGVNMPTDGSAWVWDSAGETPWALQFDGVNDVATSSSTLVKSTAYEFLFKFAYKENGYICAPFDGRGIGITNANRIDIYGSSQQVYFNIGTTISVDDQLEVRFLWTDNGNSTYELNLQVNINDAGFSGNLSVAIGSKTFSALLADRTMDFGRRPNTIFTSVDWLFFKYIESGVTLNNWDATASSHTSGTPVLIDTVGFNNATGVNMPTDGSAWIDLGGGGGGLTLVVPSIASLEAFGTPNIRRAQEILAVESILSLEAFGTPSLTIISTIAIPSIASEEAFGLPTVELTSVFVVVDSILTAEEFGTPTIIVGETFVLPVSIASAEAFGTPNVTSIGIVTQYLTVATIVSEEEFGVPDVSLFDKHLLVVSIQSGEEFGKPKILGGVQVTNTLNIPEVTLNQISDANHAINIVGNDIGNARRSVYQSAVVRVIDHDDDDATAVDDPTRMALFESKAHGQPWNKYKGYGEHSIHSGSVIETDTNMNQIFPTFEYNEFE